MVLALDAAAEEEDADADEESEVVVVAIDAPEVTRNDEAVSDVD